MTKNYPLKVVTPCDHSRLQGLSRPYFQQVALGTRKPPDSNISPAWLQSLVGWKFVNYKVLKDHLTYIWCRFISLNRVRTKLECTWIWKQKFKAVNVLDWFVKKYLKVLKFFLLQFLDIIWNCLTFKNGHFVELVLYVHIWQSCLKFIKVAFWTIQCHFLLIFNAFSSAI
jgi:hypothetical protein